VPTASEAAVVAAAAGVAAPAAPSAALSAIPEGTEAVSDVIELEALEENKQYLVNSATRAPDLRLGPELSDWPRYMSLGTQVPIEDLANPAVQYPSIEAAIASAKYQVATDKPDVGPQLFSLKGTIHQTFEKERADLVAAGAPPEALAKSVDDEMATVRIRSGKAKMKGFKATWDQAAWEASEGRDTIYPAYLEKRYAVDARFRAMIQAIRAKGGDILFVNGVDPSYLGVGVRIDGSISGGDNHVGKWMMELR
jgi:hypothetical protein